MQTSSVNTRNSSFELLEDFYWKEAIKVKDQLDEMSEKELMFKRELQNASKEYV